jgi:hypothetical protein
MRAVGGAHGALAGKGGFMKLYGLLAGLTIVAMLTGCGGSGSSATIDENKPVSQIAADASKMGKAELQTMVTKYEAAIAEKGKELAALKATKALKAKTLKNDVSKITASTGKLKDKMAAYAKELAAKK